MPAPSWFQHFKAHSGSGSCISNVVTIIKMKRKGPAAQVMDTMHEILLYQYISQDAQIFLTKSTMTLKDILS